MSPKELKQKHGLSYSKLALLLSKDQRTVERYCQGHYPEYLNTYCWLIDHYFQTNGSIPPTIWITH